MLTFLSMRTTLTNTNEVHDGITRTINSTNAYYSVKKKLLSFLPLSTSLIVRIYKIILSFVLYSCETWSSIFKGRS
jgi:hypothetical protein